MRTVSAQQLKLRMELYEKGLTDEEISIECGLDSRDAIGKWRRRNGLPAKNANHLSDDQRATRLFLYALGYSDKAIAREERRVEGAIWLWRRTMKLRPNNPQGSYTGYRGLLPSDVLGKVRRAIGRALPRDIADEAIADLYLAVIEGRVAIGEIEREARRFGNRVLGQFASKFGPRSLDQELGDDDGFTLLDTLRDESASNWLEEMGATVA